ncbi:N-acetylmuramoyl-L-alanine amidase [Halomonas sp. BM-2019]|uniref:N-acetylmuramoyl-L-alanine amidase n=1 Tax=Halomonas sp. BM-2019 TaxID=2811227 RepID=UPI001B3C3927|nr:MAG: N-acetylmuramoyl-L-alanine amidase [Halomonas sp. BM-2019]
MSVVPKSWMPKAAMQRIVFHWTAGAYRASALDRKHYHILIESDGKLVQGTHSIADNASTADNHYAAHTRRLNTGSIGISVCCMAEARERPFDAGRFPMTETQWHSMAQVAADLCDAYTIPVTPQTVLGHGEVQGTLGVQQLGKWDPLALPWEPTLSPAQVGERFRNLVSALLQGVDSDDSLGAELAAQLFGRPLQGALHADEDAFLRVESLVEDGERAADRWQLLNASQDGLVLLPGGATEPVFLECVFLDGETTIPDEAKEAEVAALVMAHGYVRAEELATALDAPLVFDADKNLLEIGEKPTRRRSRASSSPEPRRLVVKRGDTLFALAARHLGNGSRWPELLQADGTPFDEASARRLAPGDVVLVPARPGSLPPDEPDATGKAADPAQDATTTDDLVRLDPSATDALIERCIDAADPELRTEAAGSIPLIVAECLVSGVTLKAQIAYVLATSEHESKCGRFMRELWGPTAAQRGYEGRHDLGNTQPGDGFRFRGRGYVQISGRANYAFWSHRLGLDLVADPDLTYQDPSIAARILVHGMRDGTFRPPHKLLRHLNEERTDFYNAREIINGDRAQVDAGHAQDRGTRIARIAERYLAGME